MFWAGIVWASGVMSPAAVYLTDAGCKRVEKPSADKALRFVFIQRGSTSPPGGPVSPYVLTYQPHEVRLRRQGCGPEPGSWRLLEQICDGAQVLEWTGELHPGQDYRIEQQDFQVLHTFRSAGRSQATCAAQPFEPHHSRAGLRVEQVILLPRGSTTLVRGSTVIEPTVLAALAGGEGQHGIGGKGAPSGSQTEETPGVWAEVVTVERRAEERFTGPSACILTTQHSGQLLLDGVTPFSHTRHAEREIFEGPCEQAPVPTEDALRAEVVSRIDAFRAAFVPPLDCRSPPADRVAEAVCGARAGVEYRPRKFRGLLDGLDGRRTLDRETLRALVLLSPPKAFPALDAFLQRRSAIGEPIDSAASAFAWRRLTQTPHYATDPLTALESALSAPLDRETEALADLARRYRSTGQLYAAFRYAQLAHNAAEASPTEGFPLLREAVKFAAKGMETCADAPQDADAQRGCFQLQEEGRRAWLALMAVFPGDPEAEAWGRWFL